MAQTNKKKNSKPINAVRYSIVYLKSNANRNLDIFGKIWLLENNMIIFKNILITYPPMLLNTEMPDGS